MPNHVTHRVVITGPAEDMERFKAAHIRAETEGEEPTLDFETIVPAPAVIRDTQEDSYTNVGFELITGRPYPSIMPRSIMEYEWVKETGATTPDEYLAYLLRTNPEDHEAYVWAGALAVRCMEETGKPSWYEWNIANWGTKWNSYHFSVISDEPGELTIMFDTAWSPPEPVFEKLAELFPSLTINAVAFDEGWNYAWKGETEDGQFWSQTVDATDELYEAVYGEPPERDLEEDEDEELNT